MKRFGTIAALTLATGGLFAQTPCSPPVFDSFEVATIKLTPADWVRGRFIRMQTAHQLQVKNHSLRLLIAAAYNLSLRAVIGGPAWVDSEHYDILGETPCEVRPNLDQQMAMLRRLMVERYKLTFHRQQKELSIYTLTVDKSGAKMKASDPANDPFAIPLQPLRNGRLTGKRVSMAHLAWYLSTQLDRPIVDRTGLTGFYDFDLTVALPATAPDPDRPPVFENLREQLGLRLEGSKGMVDVYVIDHIERPMAN